MHTSSIRTAIHYLMTKQVLNANQRPINNSLTTDQLKRLEKRAANRVNKYTNDINAYNKRAEKALREGKHIADNHLLHRQTRLKFWLDRLELIRELLAERMLLLDE